MKISRTRLALSGLLGLTAAVVALGMATLLDHQDDPALAQSTDLRAQFTPPSGADNPVGSLRTPKPAPRAQVVQLAEPAPAAAPAAEPAAQAAPAPAATASEQAPAVQVAQLDDGEPQEHADGGEHDGGDD